MYDFQVKQSSTIMKSINTCITLFNRMFVLKSIVSGQLLSLWATHKQVDEISNSIDKGGTMDGSS